jgi:hypothetical protein
MPLTLTAAEVAFLETVESYCAAGLTQEEMAAREGLTVGGFRDRMKRIGFSIDSHTSRRLARIRTGERLADLRATGGLVIVAADAEGVAA